MANWRVFTDRILNSRRYLVKAFGVCSNLAAGLHSCSGGGRLVGGGLPSSIQSTAKNQVLGSRESEKATTFTSIRHGFSSLQAATRDVERRETPSPPWLLVPPGLYADGYKHGLIAEAEREADEKHYYQLLSAVDRAAFRVKKNIFKVPQILSPVEDDALCVGSSHGWLAFINPRNCALYLFNPSIDPLSSPLLPFIPLPPIETLPCILSSFRRKAAADASSSSTIITEYIYRDWIPPMPSKDLSNFFIWKLVMSSAPSPSPRQDDDAAEDGDNCTVVAIHGYSNHHLAFCRPGDTAWIPLDGPFRSYEEVVYFSKDQHFYALSVSGSIEAWDLRNPASPKRTLIKSALPPLVRPDMDERQRRLLRIECRLSQKYLVESSGDLLMVIRHYSCSFLDDNGNIFEGPGEPSSTKTHTRQFVIYKLDFVTKKWVHVPSLGNQMLFLGLNHSVSLDDTDFPDLSTNTIYFTTMNKLSMGDVHESDEVGLFQLEDNNVYSFFGCDSEKMQSPPVWIVPQP